VKIAATRGPVAARSGLRLNSPRSARASKYTVSITRRDYSGYFEPKFFDRIVALSRDYGIAEK
jgi:hypothetical protein